MYELTNGRCRCVKVEVFEHEKNSAIFESTAEPVAESKSNSVEVDITKPVSKEAITKSVKHVAGKAKNNNNTQLWPTKEKNTWMTGKTTWGF